MGIIIPDEGREWIADKTLDNESGIIDEVAIGTGTSSVAATDTSMESQVYSATDSDPQVSITETGDVGVVECVITVTGGTEVSGGTEITEFGVFTSTGEMVYHETAPAIPVGAGEDVEFTIPLDISNR